jgi:adenylate kinase
MDSNHLFYIIGIAGSGKTTVCKDLANDREGYKAIQTSSRFKKFFKELGSHNIDEIDSIPAKDRDKLINELHYSFIKDKRHNKFTFLDGHMLVLNTKTNKLINAMPSENKGITDGLIFLNTPTNVIADNIKNDNLTSKRRRDEVSIDTLNQRSEAEFQAAEEYCIKNTIGFGVLNNIPENGNFNRLCLDDVRYLNNYYLKADKKLRTLYKDQFDPGLLPSELRKHHFEIGQLIMEPFIKKAALSMDNYQVLSIPRSGNFIANGFCDDFNGMILMCKKPSGILKHLDHTKSLVIIDSVIDTCTTVENIINAIPSSFSEPIHVICMAINIKALSVIESLEGKVTFHCLGFSNKAKRPEGKSDMGARLYGTLN